MSARQTNCCRLEPILQTKNLANRHYIGKVRFVNKITYPIRAIDEKSQQIQGVVRIAIS